MERPSVWSCTRGDTVTACSWGFCALKTCKILLLYRNHGHPLMLSSLLACLASLWCPASFILRRYCACSLEPCISCASPLATCFSPSTPLQTCTLWVGERVRCQRKRLRRNSRRSRLKWRRERLRRNCLKQRPQDFSIGLDSEVRELRWYRTCFPVLAIMVTPVFLKIY